MLVMLASGTSAEQSLLRPPTSQMAVEPQVMIRHAAGTPGAALVGASCQPPLASWQPASALKVAARLRSSQLSSRLPVTNT